MAFADYLQKVEDWEKGCDNVVVSKDKTETISEKFDRLQNEVKSSSQYNKQNQANGRDKSVCFPNFMDSQVLLFMFTNLLA